MYAVWDRFLSPPGINANDQGKINAQSYVEQSWFSRTTDGGATWEPARVIFNPGTHAGTIGNIVVVLPNATHDLIDGFILFANHNSKIRGTQIALVRSTDHGVTWSKKPIIIAQTDPSFLGPVDPDTGQPIRGGELPDFAVGVSGNVYAVWEDDLLTGIDAIMFSESTDGGLTWSTPIKINQTPTSIPPLDQQAFTPTVKVAAKGTVGVTDYDLRSNTPAPGLPTDYWIVHCHADCSNAANWGDEARLTTTSFDIEQAPAARGPFGYFLGDYEGVTTSGNVFQPFFAQAVSCAAGNPSDVYFASLP